MFIMKPNGLYAAAVPNLEDIAQLENLEALAVAANKNDLKAIACLQRLVNGNHLPEGSY